MHLAPRTTDPPIHRAGRVTGPDRQEWPIRRWDHWADSGIRSPVRTRVMIRRRSPPPRVTTRSGRPEPPSGAMSEHRRTAPPVPGESSPDYCTIAPAPTGSPATVIADLPVQPSPQAVCAPPAGSSSSRWPVPDRGLLRACRQVLWHPTANAGKVRVRQPAVSAPAPGSAPRVGRRRRTPGPRPRRRSGPGADAASRAFTAPRQAMGASSPKPVHHRDAARRVRLAIAQGTNATIRHGGQRRTASIAPWARTGRYR